ncbi:MAG TPA: S8 family serine peptidase [Thermoanaerobaculia bacterium]
MRAFLLLLSLLSVLAAGADAQPVHVSMTTCHTVDVPAGADIIERRLIACGDGFADNVLWHLDRSDSATGALDGKLVRKTTGRGAVIYVLDTGVLRDHVEFQRPTGSNVIAGINAGGHAGCEGAELAPCYLRDFPRQSLFYGHGTSVASVAAGARVGVAPDASIVSVLYRDAPTLVTALHEIIRHAFEPATPFFRTAVVNFSLSLSSAEQTPELNALIERMTRGVDAAGNADANGKRFFFTVAAGNFYPDSSNQCGDDRSVVIYPALLGSSIDGVITVGGIDRQNAIWSGSCTGPLVEILAPVTDVLTASIVENDTYRYQPAAFSSGTSWAAPYVAGMAARLLEANPSLTPAELELALKASPSRVGGLPVAVQIESAPTAGRRRTVRH